MTISNAFPNITRCTCSSQATPLNERVYRKVLRFKENHSDKRDIPAWDKGIYVRKAAK